MFRGNAESRMSFLAVGSILVITGRQRFASAGLPESGNAPGVPHCARFSTKALLLTGSPHHRAFQGWRYLDPREARAPSIAACGGIAEAACRTRAFV